MTLVVVGHGWTLLPDGSESHPAYFFLYAWHVPAFVLVTGYLSRRFTWSRASLGALVRTVVVPSSTAGTSTRTGRCGTSRCSSCGDWRRPC